MKNLRRSLLSLLAVLLSSLGTLLAQNANDIVGTYLTEKQNAKVRIYKQGDKYFGSLIWSITEGKLDEKNPDKNERTKPLVGKVILKNFSYDGDGTWEEGTIYDPESGKTYSCKITRSKDGKLKVRGFIGISLIGRTSIWTPTKD